MLFSPIGLQRSWVIVKCRPSPRTSHKGTEEAEIREGSLSSAACRPSAVPRSCLATTSRRWRAQRSNVSRSMSECAWSPSPLASNPWSAGATPMCQGKSMASGCTSLTIRSSIGRHRSSTGTRGQPNLTSFFTVLSLAPRCRGANPAAAVLDRAPSHRPEMCCTADCFRPDHTLASGQRWHGGRFRDSGRLRRSKVSSLHIGRRYGSMAYTNSRG